MLRPITHKDIEKLRIWRNKNRDAFFYNKPVSKKEQGEWYKGYLNSNDKLYIIEYQGIDIGGIGYRPFGDCVELYNLIIDERYLRKGLMSKALKLLLKEIDGKIIARVVRGNKKAFNFYIKNGFKEVKSDIGIRLESWQ